MVDPSKFEAEIIIIITVLHPIPLLHLDAHIHKQRLYTPSRT